MPFGASNVLWHSAQGACQSSYERFYSGPDPGQTLVTLSIPTFPNASPATALFVAASATDPGGIAAPYYQDPQGVQHGIQFGRYFNAPPYTDSQFVLLAYPNIGTGGGSWNFLTGSYKLLFISGTVVRSSNAVAVACVVDIGAQGQLQAAGLGTTLGDYSTDVRAFSSGTSSAPSLTMIDPKGRGLVVAGARAVGANPIAGAGGAGWTDIIGDVQPNTQGTGSEPGNPSDPEPPSAVMLSVGDGTTPFNATETWSISTAEAWRASAGVLWLPYRSGSSAWFY